MSTYIGQILAAPENQGLSQDDSKKIASLQLSSNKICVWVASDNAIKVDAAKNAVTAWAKELFASKSFEVVATGYPTASEIDEQPHGREYTQLGAKTRMKHLKEKVKQEPEDSLHLYVSMENGLMKERHEEIKNADIFVDPADSMVWIDRCHVVVEVAYKTMHLVAESLSIGVTAPLLCVEDAMRSKWTKTGGSFIEQRYHFPAKDWHGQIAGKGRELLMQEAILMALGRVMQ